MSEEMNGAAPAAAESAPAPAPAPAPVPAPVETPAASPPSFDDDLRAAAFKIHAKHNPPRENGKFAPHIPTATPLEEQAPEAPVTDQASTAAPEQAPEPAIGAPHSWSAEEKVHWAKVPPEAQSVIARRETEAHRQISQMGQQLKAHEPLRAVSEQHADYLRQIGRTPEDAFKQALTVSQALDRDAASAIRWLAQNYRVDLQQLASGQPQPPSPAVDPRLIAEIRQLKAYVAQSESERQNQKLQAITTAIDKFAKDHPHFEVLEGEIEAQVAVLQRNGESLSPEEMLSQAYDKAQWANPTIRERILADQRKADEEKAAAEREKQVKEAKRFGTLNQRGTPGGLPVNGSWEDTLRREVEKRVPRRA